MRIRFSTSRLSVYDSNAAIHDSFFRSEMDEFRLHSQTPVAHRQAPRNSAGPFDLQTWKWYFSKEISWKIRSSVKSIFGNQEFKKFEGEKLGILQSYY